MFLCLSPSARYLFGWGGVGLAVGLWVALAGLSLAGPCPALRCAPFFGGVRDRAGLGGVGWDGVVGVGGVGGHEYDLRRTCRPSYGDAPSYVVAHSALLPSANRL